MYQAQSISVKEARKILADEGSELTDRQIDDLISNIETLAELSFEKNVVRKSGVV